MKQAVRCWVVFLIWGTILVVTNQNVAAMFCGDCDNDNEVRVNELITSVGNNLYSCSEDDCCGDCNLDGEVKIGELVIAVQGALSEDLFRGCGLGCAGPCYSPLPEDPPCPCRHGECVEFLGVNTETGILTCAVSFCDTVSLEACVLKLDELTDVCFEEEEF